MGYQQQQQQQAYGAQQPFGPPVSYQQQPGMQQPYPNPMQPQSQIETALSLPRPDPAALWLAQQEKQKGERRNTGLFIAVVALTALCVIVSAALIFLRLRGNAQAANAAAAASAQASGAAPQRRARARRPARLRPGAAPTATEAPSAAPSAAATAGAPPPEKADKPEKADRPEKVEKPEKVERVEKPSGAGAVKTEKPPPEKPAAADKEDPGFLTIVCNPYCDDVVDQGRSLGPSPIVHLSVKPGQHRITLKKDGQSKVISVIVVSQQVTAQRISMAK